MTAVLGPELAAARERVAAASRELATAGLVQSTAGNVSKRVGDLVAITPTGAHLGELTPAQVMIVDLTGAVVRDYTSGSPELAEAPVAGLEGCGDAFSAGFVRGLSLGLGHPEAAHLGCATAALVAGGLGPDHGSFGLADVQQLAAAGAAR